MARGVRNVKRRLVYATKTEDRFHSMPNARYYTLVVPGLERVAWKEIRTKLEGAELIAEEDSRLIFGYDGDPRDLLYLRSVENAYVFIRHIRGVTRSRNSLGEVFKRVRNADVLPAMALHKQAHRAKGKKGLTFRVITAKQGRHNFRRVDLQQSAETALVEQHGWKISGRGGAAEFLGLHPATLSSRLQVMGIQRPR